MSSKTTFSTSDKLSLMGLWSAFSIVLVLFVLTVVGGVSYADLLSNILSFMLGNLSTVPNGASENLTSVVLNITAVILITLLGAIVSRLIFSKGTHFALYPLLSCKASACDTAGLITSHCCW